MRRRGLMAFALLVQGCSADNTAGGAPDGSSSDAVLAETGAMDTGTQPDAATATDTSADDRSAQDTGMEASADDGSSDAPGEAAIADAGDGGCSPSWMTAPTVDPSIAVPSDGGAVLLHASATGTQNYTCSQSDAGFSWAFVGPEAELHDCNAAVIGHHFASDAGPSAPEWQTTDGTYVIGKRAAPPFVPDGGAMSVPWLLLQATAHGGTTALSRAGYIQRLYTDGGVAPSTTCDQTVAGGAQASQKVPYSADYYFFGP